MFWIAVGAAVFMMIVLMQGIWIVPQQQCYIVERLGKFHAKLEAGLHFLIPFIDSVRYRHELKEFVLDIPAQVCITRDNVSVNVDGVLFFRVVDPIKASYGTTDYIQAIIQLAQTTLRSEIGKMDLDRTFEEREKINNGVILSVDQATDPWGVKVLRYEIKSITPPRDVLDAMEKQMRAEREKRAKILESEGDRDSKINRAEGLKQETIKASEADKTKQINEAEGRAQAILSITSATAEGLRQVALAISAPGGGDAARLRVAEEYVKQIAHLAAEANTIIVPANVGDPSALITSAFTVFDQIKANNGATR
ncbi:MAG: SPFH/Band 7/PHB domain protein [Bdellovibrionaceae bacterium]|nr:SPFH/Band 7/PHB domain protein [Pseudobdellovibrionaceae bacterium]